MLAKRPGPQAEGNLPDLMEDASQQIHRRWQLFTAQLVVVCRTEMGIDLDRVF